MGGINEIWLSFLDVYWPCRLVYPIGDKFKGGRIMIKRKAFRQNYKIYRETIEEISLANKIAKKVSPLLPNDWNVDFVIGMWRGLLFSCWDHGSKEHSAIEFKLVCKLVEKATGLEMKRKAWTEGEYLVALKGEAYIPINDNHSLLIEVRQMDAKDCELEFEETTVKQVKVSDKCVGLI